MGLPQLRWWDNHAWTEYTSDARQPMVAETFTQQARLTYAEPDDAGDDAGTRRERREREREAESVDSPTSYLETPAAQPAAAQHTYEPAVDSDGVLGEVETAKPAADSLRALEAPAREAVVEEEQSPAAKFAEFVTGSAPTTPAYQLDSRFDDLLGDTLTAQNMTVPTLVEEPPAVAEQAPAVETVSVTGSTSTAGAWIIATIPVIMLVVNMFLLLSDLAGEFDGLGLIVMLGLPYVAGILLSFLDWMKLRRKGYVGLAHWTWSFATPFGYLLARWVGLQRTTGRGWGPLLTMVLLAGVNAMAIAAVPGLVIVLDPPAFSQQVEDSVEGSAAAFGADIIVDCPDQPPTIVGQSFTCIAQTDDESPVTWGIVVSLARANLWFEWRVNDWGIYKLDTGV